MAQKRVFSNFWITGITRYQTVYIVKYLLRFVFRLYFLFISFLINLLSLVQQLKVQSCKLKKRG